MRACEHCGGNLPVGAQRNRRFCSKSCGNAAYRAANPADPERQRAYGRRSYAKGRAALLAGIGARACEECGATLPTTSRLRRRYCSRRCINQRSLRERGAERREATHRRRARLLAATEGSVSDRDWRRMVERYRGCCAYCGERATLTVDHVIPLSRGGRHAIGNLLPACQSCNSSKRDDFLSAWRNGRATARLAA